jgi:ADP-ribosylglycohydrolase
VEKAITLGDDTDTLAAMAGALCGAHLGATAIPLHWLEHLEDGPKGASYLRMLADKLHKLHVRLASEEDNSAMPL